MPLRLNPTFRHALAARGDGAPPLAGIWISSGSPLVAEVCAGSGLDWLLLDGEHSAIGIESTLAMLQAVAPYDSTPIVRVPSDDAVLIKQMLDLGAQNLLVPMISTAEEARSVVAAVRYPPRGIRGVGSAVARSSRWNRIPDYLQNADEYTSLTIQIETAEGVENVDEIAAVDGVDAVFVGPADLAASLRVLGQQNHPDVRAAVLRVFEAVKRAGKPVGILAFDPEVARSYADAGADFIAVTADVTLVARGAEALAAQWAPASV